MFSIRKTCFRKRWWILAGIWFALWHLFFTWEVWSDPLRRVPGPIGDNTVMLWNLGWVRYALSHGNPGYWFTNAYYPDGFLFLYGTHTWLDGVLYWLASPLLPAGIDGTILWANISHLGATVTTGLLVMACLRTWGLTRWQVLLMAGSAVAFCWFRMFALTGHYHFFATQYMLAALWLLLKGRRDYLAGKTKHSQAWMATAGLMLGISFLNDQAMAVFGSMLGGLVILSMWAASGWKGVRTPLITAGLYYGFSLITAAIHLIPLAMAIMKGKFDYKVETDGPRLVDASSMIVPPTWHLFNPFVEYFRDHYALRWSEGTYIGIVPLLMFLLMCCGSVRYLLIRKNSSSQAFRLCLYSTLAAGCFLLMALGDRLMIGREQYFMMPGRLLKELPVINNIRLPQRWIWPAHLCIALGGASILTIIIDRFRGRWRHIAWFPLVLAVVSGVEGKKYPAPAPVDFRNDPFLVKPKLVRAVKNQYKSGGVLVMPIKPYFPYGNILQFQWGYDIPVTMSYNARMPFLPDEVPWRGNGWSAEAGPWLQSKQVSFVVFPAHPGDLQDYKDWIKNAKAAVPGLVVLNGVGEQI